MSVLAAARNRPSGLTVEPMNLPYLVTQALAERLDDLVGGDLEPGVEVLPTWWLPKPEVLAWAAPVPATARVASPMTAMRAVRAGRTWPGPRSRTGVDV